MREVHFILNGRPVSVTADENELLVDTIRGRFGLCGTKEGCRAGDCGTCTVLLEGTAVRSCLLLTCSVEGRHITTIEGLGDRDHIHPIQQAFIDAGAVQCGFCTPGMVLTAKALLDRNPHPGEREIRVALSGNLCRCTGYEKIIKAVQLASQRMDPTPETE
ncbi:MAG: (2Fe-2S)-binding protein [Lachnospiraceae bacterium]|nr:(2Fe-2S)-binding protein [Lachnospiraceae bacterium]